ncbi:MAG TPA: DUF1338 domain-containing protein [Planctomycetia bacterium]|nr:DUF1338 domain-containing protein [Planctomycetia bacterium]
MALAAPHRVVEPKDERERFLVELFDALWVEYRERVTYVRQYEEVVAKLGGSFFNDHIAFRTFGRQRPQVGIVTLSRIFEALGYVAANCYQFPDKHLSSIHYQHANPRLPKLFITQLETWKLSAAAAGTIDAALASHPPALSDAALFDLAHVDAVAATRRSELLSELRGWFTAPLWPAPDAAALDALNKESQFAAWVLVHGYRVNHFTALVNSHGVAAMDDIEKTIAELKQAGIPMKSEIEGARGTKLRQTATEAAMVDVAVKEGGKDAKKPWTYAYFEIAERGMIADPETGRTGRFEGFLGPQATNLFEMTRVKG